MRASQDLDEAGRPEEARELRAEAHADLGFGALGVWGATRWAGSKLDFVAPKDFRVGPIIDAELGVRGGNVQAPVPALVPDEVSAPPPQAGVVGSHGIRQLLL